MIYFKRKDFLILPALYVGLCLTLYTAQRSLLYFPDKSDTYNNKIWQPIVTNNEVLALESKDYFEKTIILFHGNTTNASSQSFYRKFFPKNVHLIVVEYPGYGLNNTMSINKENFINHARKVMKYAKEKYGNNIILTGESLGSGIASQMANEFNVEKLFLITPYTTIGEVAQGKFWYAPISLLLKDNYDNINNLKNYKGETFLLISEKDTVIPPKYADKLYSSITNKKEKIMIKDASHSNWDNFITEEQLEQLRRFLNIK